MNIDEVLYDQLDGIFMKLRAGIKEKDEAQIDFVRNFVKEVCDAVNNNGGNAKDALKIANILYNLCMFDYAEWPVDLAREIHGIINGMINI